MVEKSDKPVHGFICGTWDLLHAGHIMALFQARELCDTLLVGLQVENENKPKPIQTFNERLVQLRSCRFVDEILYYTTESELEYILKRIKPDIRFLGDDYRDGSKPITAADAAAIVYLDRGHGFSTSELIQRCKDRG